MSRPRFLARSLLFLFIFLPVGSLLGADKVRFGVPFKQAAHLLLPVLAAEEKGFWKEAGLETESSFFSSGMERVMAAGSLDLGFLAASTAIQSAAHGAPIVILADLHLVKFFIWVRADSHIKEPKDLKGARIDALRLGSMNHAYGLLAAKALGLDKDIKFVALGEGPAGLAALKAGKIDGRIGSFQFQAPLKFRGEIRELLTITDYFPREWVDNSVVARADFMEKKPDAIKNALKAVFKSVNFLAGNPQWAIDKMKSEYGYSDEVARAVYDSLSFSRDGKITRRAMENVRDFLLEYGLVPRDKVPAVEALYTARFLE